MPYLEITEVILMHCNVANDGYQQNSRFLYKFVANKSFGQLLIISSKKVVFKNICKNFHTLKCGLQITILIL